MEEKLIFTTDEGEEVEFTPAAQIRMGGRDYLLVTYEEGEEEEALILKDVSPADSDEAVYEPVEDDAEIEALLPLFEEAMDVPTEDEEDE